jgi:hypothetical protein
MQWTVRRKLVALTAFWGVMLLVVSGLGLMAIARGQIAAERLSQQQVMTMNHLGNVRWYVALVRTAAILSTASTGAKLQQQLHFQRGAQEPHLQVAVQEVDDLHRSVQDSAAAVSHP